MNVQDLMTYDSLNFKLSMYIGIFKILHDNMITLVSQISQSQTYKVLIFFSLLM